MWHLKIVICSYFKWGVLRVRMCNPGLIILLILANFSNALNFYDDCGIDKARPMLEKKISLFKSLHHFSYLRPSGAPSYTSAMKIFTFTTSFTKQQTIQKLSAVVEKCVEGQRTTVRRKAGRKLNGLNFDNRSMHFYKSSSAIWHLCDELLNW